MNTTRVRQLSALVNTGSWNVAVSPNDGFIRATIDETYTARTPVATRESISGENLRILSIPDLIRLNPAVVLKGSDYPQVSSVTRSGVLEQYIELDELPVPSVQSYLSYFE